MKELLDKAGIPYLFADLNAPPENWRELDLSGGLVVSAWKNDALPIVRWRGTWMTGFEARRRIEHGLRRREDASR